MPTLPFSYPNRARPPGDVVRPARIAGAFLAAIISIGPPSVNATGSEPNEKAEKSATPGSWRENARANSGRTEAAPSPAPTISALPGPSSASKLVLPVPFTVALDIGHTPKKGGAISARGVFEYEFNRRLVEELAAKLQLSRAVQNFVVNPDGAEISLTRRVEQARQHQADLFLAIHHDSVKDSFLKKWEVGGKTQKYCDDFHGYSLFVSGKNPKALESLALANALGKSLLRAGFTPTLHHAEQEHRLVLDQEKGIYLFDDLIVLKAAKMPAVLLECGVIVNREEERNLNDPKYRGRLIDAIASGLEGLAGEPRKN